MYETIQLFAVCPRCNHEIVFYARVPNEGWIWGKPEDIPAKWKKKLNGLEQECKYCGNKVKLEI